MKMLRNPYDHKWFMITQGSGIRRNPGLNYAAPMIVQNKYPHLLSLTAMGSSPRPCICREREDRKSRI